MTSRDPRTALRSILGSPRRPEEKRLSEDYASRTIGSQADGGSDGLQPWAGSNQFGTTRMVDDMNPFDRVTRALNEFQSGVAKDDQKLQLFQELIQSGLIEYMNDDLRKIALSLLKAGYLESINEGDAFTREVDGQEAQKETPKIKVKSGAPKAESGSGVSGDSIGKAGQDAQMGPAEIPAPEGKAVTSVGHDEFKASGKKEEDAADIPDAAGSQAAGPNSGDKMAGASQSMKVGQSLQQGGTASSGNYTGSKVGAVKEEKSLRRIRRRV